MTAQLDMLALISEDLTHHRDRQAVIDAIRHAVDVCGPVVSANDWRPHVPPWVFHKVIGATVSHLTQQQVLVATGSPVRSTDTKGGNAGRWIPQYRVNMDRLGAL